MLSTQQQNVVYPFQADEGSGITRSGANKYPNPFCDIASEYVPRDLNVIFEWCEYIFLTFGTYRAAAQRVVRYFLTELELDGETDDEREDYKDFLDNTLHLIQQLAEVGDEFMVYGQSFVSLYFPFDRFLICPEPECGMQYHCDTVKYRFEPKTQEFKGDCQRCGATDVTFKREDRRSPERERVKLIRWSPKDMRLRVHPISNRMEYYLQLDAKFVRDICSGKHFYLKDTPWSMIQACTAAHNGQNQYMYKFQDGAIYHLRNATLSGLPIKGWAIPPIMPNFKLAYYVQLLRRYDEAIALDFIVPFRVLFPKSKGSTSGMDDALSMMSMQNFQSNMRNMVEKKRKNVTDIQVAPIEIGYEMLGGEAKALTPKDSIVAAVDELLNAVGYPAELYKGSLSIQAFPVALRLFEKNWNALVEGFNDLISWILIRLSRHFMWGEITGQLRSVTLADDIEMKALALQAAAGMDISKQTAYRPLGIDFMEEQRRALEEQEAIMQLQQESMERQEVQQQGQGAMSGAQGGQAAMPAGAGGMPPGGQPGATPGDVYEQGQMMAQQLLINTPESARRGELIKIKHSNPTLHAIVLQEMDTMRQEMARQGQAMMMEQAKMASAGQKEKMAEYRKLPSPLSVGLLISDQVLDYNRGDLRKMAMAIKAKQDGAKDAFHFVFARMKGWV
jgi:hypothetical protein